MAKTKFKQGVYTPTNPDKWYGEKIIYRSSWEFHFMKFLDNNSNVSKVASEEVSINYYYEVDKKWHRYFPDFLFEYKDKNSEIRTVMVEIKPFKETLPPKKGNKKESTFLNEVLTYEKNISKWKAAEAWCKERNIKFMIITERELQL